MNYCAKCWESFSDAFKADKIKESAFLKLGCIHNYKTIKNIKNIKKK